MKASTTVIIDTRRALKNGKYPVKLRVTFNGEQHYYPANLSVSVQEFEQVKSKNPKGDYKRWKLKLDALEQRANHIIDGMSLFDFNQFKKELYIDYALRDDVYNHYRIRIDKLKQSGSIGTATSYAASLKSLQKFKSKLTFKDITVDFLNSYERSLLEEEKSITTVGIYLRPLRAVINDAISDGKLPADYKYPFGSRKKQKYQIPTGRNIKKALTLPEIKLLFDYNAEPDSWEQKAVDFWIFSYLANGINIMDIAHLKNKNVASDFIYFVRAKTKNTNKVVSTISIPLNKDLNGIIARQRSMNKDPDGLLFPIMTTSDTIEKQYASVKQFTKMINKYIKLVAGSIGIKKPITTYYARHSYSTVLKRSGVSIEYISESLGHSSTNTTRAYLDSFEDETKKEIAKALTAFV